MATAMPERLEVPIDPGEPEGLYEVIDGRVVEKMIGAYECWLAAVVFGVMDPTSRRTRLAVSSRK
jgi:hypothetical protein